MSMRQLSEEVRNAPVTLTTQQVVLLVGHTTLGAGLLLMSGQKDLATNMMRDALAVAEAIHAQNDKARMAEILPAIRELAEVEEA